jgi:hypothetical protein
VVALRPVTAGQQEADVLACGSATLLATVTLPVS